MNQFTIGLVQMRCSATQAANMAKAEAAISEAAKRGAQIVCLPELFLGPYFCRRKTRASSTLLSQSLGRRPNGSPAAAKLHGVVVIGSLFEKRMPGVYHNTATVHDANGQFPRHLPQDAHPGRSALLREVLLHAGRPRLQGLRQPAAARSARSSAGTQWYRKRPGSRRCRAPR